MRVGPATRASRCTARSSGRTAAPPARCDELRAAGHEPLVRERDRPRARPLLLRRRRSSGCCATSTACASARATGRAVFGTIDAWLIFKLTGEHVTDASNASRTLLYDIRRRRWDPELLELLGVPERALPEVRPSCGDAGDARGGALPGHDGVAGGRRGGRPAGGAVRPGVPRSRAWARTPTAPARSCCSTPAHGRRRRAPGLLATVAWRHRRATDLRARGGDLRHRRRRAVAARRAGDHRATPPRREALAASLDSNDGVYFVPALTGLGSPHWDPYARGTIVGLTRGSGRAHLARAALEAIAYQTVDAVRAMEAAPAPSRSPSCGPTAARPSTRWLMQFQADVLGVPVVVPEIAETTALGAAYLAGVGAGPGRSTDVRARLARARALRAARWARTSARRCSRGWRARASSARGGLGRDVTGPPRAGVAQLTWRRSSRR